MAKERSNVNISLLTTTIRLLSRNPEYGSVRFDQFSGRKLLNGGRELDDFALANARVYLAERGVQARPDILHSAFAHLADQHRFDSLLQHVEELPEWDQRPRLDTWLTTWLGAEDAPLTRWIGRKFLISAMARAYNPGCQVDHCLVLHGARQGEGKSRIVRILGGPFTREMTCSVTDKDAKIQLQGAWFVEFADLGSLRRTEINAVKGFMTQQTDNFRPLYAHASVAHPRRCVFVVTTNEIDFIDDPSGARRFWPITVFPRKSGFCMYDSERNQLLSEAKRAYLDGEIWYPDLSDSSSPITSLMEAQASLQQTDIWLDDIEKFVYGRTEVSLSEVILKAIGKDRAVTNRSDQMRVASCLKHLGYKMKIVRCGDRFVRRYVLFTTLTT